MLLTISCRSPLPRNLGPPSALLAFPFLPQGSLNGCCWLPSQSLSPPNSAKSPGLVLIWRPSIDMSPMLLLNLPTFSADLSRYLPWLKAIVDNCFDVFNLKRLKSTSPWLESVQRFQYCPLGSCLNPEHLHKDWFQVQAWMMWMCENWGSGLVGWNEAKLKLVVLYALLVVGATIHHQWFLQLASHCHRELYRGPRP